MGVGAAVGHGLVGANLKGTALNGLARMVRELITPSKPAVVFSQSAVASHWDVAPIFSPVAAWATATSVSFCLAPATVAPISKEGAPQADEP